MPWTLQVLNLDELSKRINPEKLKAGIKTSMTKATLGVRDYARDIVAYKTGTLRRSIYNQVDSGGLSAFIAQDPSQAIYGKYVEYGTGIYGPKGQPYTISPVNKKALYWEGASHPMKSVTIKGMKARPFMSKSLEDKKQWVLDTFHAMIENLLGNK